MACQWVAASIFIGFLKSVSEEYYQGIVLRMWLKERQKSTEILKNYRVNTQKS
jgi:hypothetical protein